MEFFRQGLVGFQRERGGGISPRVSRGLRRGYIIPTVQVYAFQQIIVNNYSCVQYLSFSARLGHIFLELILLEKKLIDSI